MPLSASELDRKNTSFSILQFDTSFLTHYFEKMYIFQSRQKYAEVVPLVFLLNGKHHQFTSMLNGLSCNLKLFRKILKPLLTALRQKGDISSNHIGQLYLEGQTLTYAKIMCLILSVEQFDALGLISHRGKSPFEPTKYWFSQDFH